MNYSAALDQLTELKRKTKHVLDHMDDYQKPAEIIDDHYNATETIIHNTFYDNRHSLDNLLKEFRYQLRKPEGYPYFTDGKSLIEFIDFIIQNIVSIEAHSDPILKLKDEEINKLTRANEELQQRIEAHQYFLESTKAQLNAEKDQTKYTYQKQIEGLELASAKAIKAQEKIKTERQREIEETRKSYQLEIDLLKNSSQKEIDKLRNDLASVLQTTTNNKRGIISSKRFNLVLLLSLTYINLTIQLFFRTPQLLFSESINWPVLVCGEAVIVAGFIAYLKISKRPILTAILFFCCVALTVVLFQRADFEQQFVTALWTLLGGLVLAVILSIFTFGKTH